MATGAPGTNGVWQYGEDDSEATFSALLNKAASTTDTQIGADRTRLTALEARKLSGLVPIVPSSITVSGGTATVNSTGAVTLGSGITSISLNGVFTSTYNQYRIVLDLKTSVSGGASTRFRFRKTGTDRTTGYYGSTFGTYFSGSAIQVENRSNGADGWAGHYGTDEGICEIDISPLQNSMKYNLTHYSIPIGAAFQGGYSTNATGGADGFTLYPSTGSFTSGNIKVYGYLG